MTVRINGEAELPALSTDLITKTFMPGPSVHGTRKDPSESKVTEVPLMIIEKSSGKYVNFCSLQARVGPPTVIPADSSLDLLSVYILFRNSMNLTVAELVFTFVNCEVTASVVRDTDFSPPISILLSLLKTA